MVGLRYIIFMFFLFASQSKATEISPCNGQPPVKAGFDLQSQKVQLDSTAVRLMAKWREDLRTLNPVGAAENHNERIAEVYEKFLTDRRVIYMGSRCEVYSVKKCASGVSGKKKLCPMKVMAPEGAWFNYGLNFIDNDFEEVPVIAVDKMSVSYIVKKTGKGSNTAGFKAPVGFLPSVVDRYVDTDFAQVHAYFSPLVRISGHTGD